MPVENQGEDRHSRAIRVRCSLRMLFRGIPLNRLNRIVLSASGETHCRKRFNLGEDEKKTQETGKKKMQCRKRKNRSTLSEKEFKQ